MIRLPISQPARMTIGVSDEAGEILALYRMADGTVFSSDVAITKARNAYYFSTREGYEVLRGFVDRKPRPLPLGARAARRPGWAITARTLNFGGQPPFPPGVDLAEHSKRRNDERHGPVLRCMSTTRRTPAPKARDRAAAAIAVT